MFVKHQGITSVTSEVRNRCLFECESGDYRAPVAIADIKNISDGTTK